MEQILGDTILHVIILLAGAPMGSFAALLADRLPRGRPVVLTRSHCTSCRGTLRWWELVPLFSYVLLRGRCSRCQGRIPTRLWQAEVAGLALAGLALWAGLGVLGAAVFWCLLALILSDLRFYRLPDALTGTLGLLAGAMAFWPPGSVAGGWDGLWLAVAGGAVGAGIFWALSAGYLVLRGRPGMGAGDIRLMAGLGALMVPAAGWDGLALMTLTAGLSGLFLGLWRSLRRGRGMHRHLRLPFGACLAGAAIIMRVVAAPGLI